LVRGDRLDVLGVHPGEDDLIVEACFPDIGCVTDTLRLEVAAPGSLRITCLDGAFLREAGL
jgi:hypothetical protein